MMPSIRSRKTSGFKMQHEAFGDEGAEHQRGASDQALQRDIRRQRAEAFERHRLAQIKPERTCGFGGEKGAFVQAVEQKQRHAERPGRHHDAGEIADDRAADRQVPELRLDLMAVQPVSHRHHRDQKQADRDIDGMRRQRQQRPRAKCGGRNPRDRIGEAGAPVDLAPPGENAREVRHHGRDRHDRNGFLRPVLIDQYRHQHDRRTRADNARDGAGEQADDEDEEEAQGCCLSRFPDADIMVAAGSGYEF